MNLNKVRLPFVIVIAILASSTTAQAAPFAIIDQQNPGPATDIFTDFAILGDGVTQGFTPTLSGIDALELSVETIGTSSSIRIDIFAGDGDGGPLLGSSGTLNITNTTFATKHFDFAADKHDSSFVFIA